MTWRELIHMITDITKQISDDSQFNEDHVAELCSTYRNYILKQQYSTNKKTIAEANYQIVQIPLEVFKTYYQIGELKNLNEIMCSIL